MKINRHGINYDIDLHYGQKKLCLSVHKDGANDYTEHDKLYTMTELLKRLDFIKFGTPEYCCIQEIDAHCDSLRKIDALKQEIRGNKEDGK
jgi:hypothetical protein